MRQHRASSKTSPASRCGEVNNSASGAASAHRYVATKTPGNSVRGHASPGISGSTTNHMRGPEIDNDPARASPAMADTRRAIRLVRSRAADCKIKSDRIGVLGFSAGGELAALAAMESDNGDPMASAAVERAGCRLDFQVLIYPGSSSRFTVRTGMPPAFIALGANDRDYISLGRPGFI